MITVQGISKSFTVSRRSAGLKHALKSLITRDHTVIHALQDITFSIPQGEIVGYIGPNGAGKSTTIKIMCGILVPDGGQCQVMGYTPWKERVNYVRHIGVVFGQRSQLWWDVPVMDSFQLLKDIYDIPASEYSRTLAILTETLSLTELLQTPVRQLSLGQRMRCEIAASLLHNPDVLFLDEPTIGLDAVSKLAVRNFIKTYNKERNLTVILTTHDMSDIEALADRILLIGKGHLLYDGDLADLRNRFGTYRTITIDYADTDELLEIAGTTKVSGGRGRTVLLVDTEQVKVSECITEISRQVEVVDVSVESQPVEDMIIHLYREYQI
jgi:ABC-2 type transport system ATP-binding protein